MKSLRGRLIVDNSTVNFLGLGVRALRYEEFFEFVDACISNKSRRSKHVALINAYCVVSALRDERLARIYNGADLIVPDGMPFVYWIRRLLKKPCHQFDASSILTGLIERSVRTEYKFYLLGGHPDVLYNMKCNLENQFTHIRIVGYRSPPFRSLSAEEDQEICEEINALKPDIVCVGLGTPKQDYWIDEHITKITGAVMVPCGATFDFFGGRIKRAPDYIQRSGCEWLYRLFSKDFKRLLPRYTVLNGVFLMNFLCQILGTQVRYPNPWERV